MESQWNQPPTEFQLRHEEFVRKTLREMNEMRENIIHRAICARLCDRGRILPGEVLVQVQIGEKPITLRQQVVFPDYARRQS
jgi:MOSC domain-containing protein YiiM